MWGRGGMARDPPEPSSADLPRTSCHSGADQGTPCLAPLQAALIASARRIVQLSFSNSVCKRRCAMLASRPAPCALPAGQRCFSVHNPRSVRPGRPQPASCSSSRQPATAAAAAPPADSSSGSSSKRQLLLGAAGLLAAGPLLGLPAAAEEAAASSSGGSSRRAFFDISVDRKPFGRFVVEVPADAPKIGGQRFLDLAQVRLRGWGWEMPYGRCQCSLPLGLQAPRGACGTAAACRSPASPGRPGVPARRSPHIPWRRVLPRPCCRAGPAGRAR